MTTVEFEQLLSYRPVAADCLRDIIFNHYLAIVSWDHQAAAKLTKAHTDQLYARFVKAPDRTPTPPG